MIVCDRNTGNGRPRKYALQHAKMQPRAREDDAKSERQTGGIHARLGDIPREPGCKEDTPSY